MRWSSNVVTGINDSGAIHWPKRVTAVRERNRLIKENRVGDYTSPNLALGMVPVEFGAGTSRWAWKEQPAFALNPFGTMQGGYLAVFIDELLSTAIASILDDGEWAMTAKFKINFLRALTPTVDRHSASAAAQPHAGVPRGAGGNGGWTNRGDRKLNVGCDKTLTTYRYEARERESQTAPEAR